MLLDITTHDQKTVVTLLKAFLPETTIWAFGSRMKFTSKPESDLDLVAFIDPEQQSQLAELKDAFAESDLPFKVDVLDWNVIPDNFKENIKKDYVTLQDASLELPLNWKNYHLADLIQVKHGYAFKGEFFSDTPTKNVLLTPGNFKIGGGFKNAKFKFYKGSYPIKYILSENDLVVTMTDLSKAGDTLGYSAKIPTEKGVNYLHNQRIGLVELKTNDIDKDFLYWVLRTQLYHHYILGSSTGSTVKHTSPTKIYNYKFSAPSSRIEQQAIANILSSLDNKIDVNQQITQSLEKIAQNVFKEWFIKFNFPGFDGFFVDELPKGWRKSKLGEVVEVKGGGTPSTSNNDYWNGNIFWTTPKDLSDNKSHVLLSTERKITKAGLQQISSGILPKGTLLLSSRAPIGYLAISQVPVAINQGYIAIQGKTVSNYFMLYWLIQNMDSIKGRANGSTFQEISKSNFKDIDIVIPDSKTLKNFDNIATSIFCKIVTNEIENENLSELRDSLLPKLMDGKIQISDGLD
ncbi:restriction endonuclease subunit S [Mucilaginibacter sp.]|uniref:restriction endonuclease subunit S n=1 Tax=Mucilaginibacter sp. TaxID=1882438 RepID=UPI002630B880|nr:restriction endonuclease subunit S [Mucilaginibacter sp.]MDB4920644.1 hypothetical protein [Mucilaginibacter sp.]